MTIDMKIEPKVRPHVAQAYQELEQAETEAEAWYAVFTLAAKLKFHDQGRDIDQLTREETDNLIFWWLEGNDTDECEMYVDRAIDLIIEYMDEEDL